MDRARDLQDPGRLLIFHCDVRPIWAGGQSQLLELALGLRERGHRQRMVTRPGSPLARRAAAAEFEILAHPHPRELDPRAVVNLRRLIDRHRPDVVHTHDSPSLTTAALAARLVRPRPRVVAHRRVDFHLRPHPLSRWKYARGPDRLIAVSEAVREVLVEDGVPATRVEVVHDGIRLDLPPSEAAPDLRERVGAGPGDPLVVTFASLEAYKDHPTLLRTAALLFGRRPDVRWAVLGTGSRLQATRAAVAAKGLAGRLRYLGFVEEARSCLPQADLFVLTSRTEGLGTSVLEAMAARVPVVATAAGGIPEAVEDGHTGLLAPPGDARALAAAIERILEDPLLARRLAAAAAARVREFSLARTVDGTERVYRELCAERPYRSLRNPAGAAARA